MPAHHHAPESPFQARESVSNIPLCPFLLLSPLFPVFFLKSWRDRGRESERERDREREMEEGAVRLCGNWGDRETVILRGFDIVCMGEHHLSRTHALTRIHTHIRIHSHTHSRAYVFAYARTIAHAHTHTQ